MFVTEVAAVLSHPIADVDALVASLPSLPCWLTGVRRAPGGFGGSLVYDAADAPLHLAAYTVERVTGAHVVHRAVGRGVTFTWAISLADGGGHTRLCVRTALAVDAAAPTDRAALCRLVARRAPDDLARLGDLLERRAGRQGA